jgi:hypothetical protein
MEVMRGTRRQHVHESDARDDAEQRREQVQDAYGLQERERWEEETNDFSRIYHTKETLTVFGN